MLYSYLIWSFSMWFICFVRCVFVAKPSLPCIFLPTSIRQGKLWDLIIVLCLLPFQSLPPWPCDRLKLCYRLVIILKNTAPDHTVLESLRVWSVRSWPQGQANQPAVTLSFSSLISGSCVFVFSVWLLQHWGSLYLLDPEGPLWWERCSSVCCWVGLCSGWVLLHSLCIWTNTLHACFVFK